MRRSKTVAIVVLTAVLAAAGSAVATSAIQSDGSIPDADGTFHACYDQSNGAVRLVSVEGACRNSEIPTFWSQTGPAGEPGTPGEQGPPGVTDAYFDSGGGVVRAGQEVVVGSLSVPAGSYVVHGKTKVRPAPDEDPDTDESTSGACILAGADTNEFDFRDKTSQERFNGDYLNFLAIQTFEEPSTIDLSCFTRAGSNSGAIFEGTNLVAITVGAIHR